MLKRRSSSCVADLPASQKARLEGGQPLDRLSEAALVARGTDPPKTSLHRADSCAANEPTDEADRQQRDQA